MKTPVRDRAWKLCDALKLGGYIPVGVKEENGIVFVVGVAMYHQSTFRYMRVYHGKRCEYWQGAVMTVVTKWRKVNRDNLPG